MWQDFVDWGTSTSETSAVWGLERHSPMINPALIVFLHVVPV